VEAVLLCEEHDYTISAGSRQQASATVNRSVDGKPVRDRSGRVV